MKLTSIVTATALASASAFAFAGGDYAHDKHKQEMNKDAYTFEQFDKNNNGELEESEIMSTNQGRNLDATEFETIDTNSDGVVSRSEWREVAGDEQS